VVDSHNSRSLWRRRGECGFCLSGSPGRSRSRSLTIRLFVDGIFGGRAMPAAVAVGEVRSIVLKSVDRKCPALGGRQAAANW
jgi:hypothetical protein